MLKRTSGIVQISEVKDKTYEDNENNAIVTCKENNAIVTCKKNNAIVRCGICDNESRSSIIYVSWRGEKQV